MPHESKEAEERLRQQLHDIYARHGLDKYGRRIATPVPPTSAVTAPPPPPPPVETPKAEAEVTKKTAEREPKEEQRAEIRRALQLFPNEVFEIRILKAQRNGRSIIVAGYFNNVDIAVEAVLEYDGRAEGVYTTLNAIHDGLLARAPNKLVPSPESATADRDVTRRKFILLDFDPKRPKGISSSDAELKQALQVARACYQWLKEQGFPDCISACSGNGYHVVVPVDLPNDAESTQLVKRFLEVIAKRFNSEQVEVDAAVHNASRIVKLWGTTACKGNNTAERPHRWAKLLKVPATIEVVSRELLEKVAPSEAAAASSGSGGSDAAAVDAMRVWLVGHGLEIAHEGPYRDSHKFTLRLCPFSDQHAEAAVFLNSSGARGFHCFHETCKGKHWEDVVQLLEPETSAASETASAAPWPAPEPLGGELTAVPGFDLKMLPEALRPLTADVAERMQVPPEVPAAVTLVALGAATGRRAYMQPKQRDTTWRVFPHVWGMVVMPSGFLKTPTLAAILAPYREIEDQWWHEHNAALAEYQRQKERADTRLAAWREELKSAYKKHKPEPLRPDDPPPEPVCRRLIVNEYTKEKLHLLLSQNPGGLLSFKDELAGLFAQLDELGHAGDKQFLMEMWNVQRYTRDTISRGTQHSDSGISMLGGMTPQSLHWYLAEASQKSRLDDGLLQRFQLAVEPDQQNWEYIDRLPNYEAMKQAKASYERLLALDPARPLQFCFDQEAQQLFRAWQRELEARLRDGTLHPALVSHLSKYRSLMPALALLFELADNTSETTVSLQHAQQAGEWCSFLEAHARRIYSPAISAVRQAAAELGRHLAAGWKREEGTFTLREVCRNHWSGLNTAEILREALEILSDANWVRPVQAKVNGRPSEKYVVNPRLKEAAPCPANG